MTTPLVSPQANFMAWLNRHYDTVDSPTGPYLACTRCGDRVSYVTKHAAVRHGDHIEVMPAKNLALADAY